MAKRLNPKRRAELRARREAIARNGSTQGNETVRSNSGQWNRQLVGSSSGLARGLLHQEANLPVFSQHKRRKPTVAAVHVNPSDLEVILTPDKVKGWPTAAEWPTSKRQIRQGNKVVVQSRKPFGNI